ncbi:MAG: HAMP domain-containing histidine kinase [Candidatus Latescibacterota bacterium]|nr:MAG: HAMP domain-containing histidine kinase [Candidatus Latescibacterota bacterium]
MDLQSNPSAIGSLERRTWSNWILLLGTLAVSTLGLATALVPFARSHFLTFWPWANTGLVLLAGLSVTVLVFAFYLTQKQRQIAALQRHFLQLQEEAMTRDIVQVRENVKKLTLDHEQMQRDTMELRVEKESLEERNLRLLEVHRLTGQFVDHISHEFRTPLTVIKQYTEVLCEGERDNERRKHLDTMANRADDLIVMIDGLLDISKMRTDSFGVSRKPHRVEDLVRRVRPTLDRRAAVGKVSCTVSFEPQLPQVYCDADRIGRVLVNLVMNAVKFSSAGSRVEVWARHEPADFQVRIGVTDHGKGIEPEHFSAIFKRFRQLDSGITTSTRGLGIGLTIAKELTHLNFGDIELESEPGKGSEFSITLPEAAPSTLLPRYLKRVVKLRSDLDLVSLIGITAETDSIQKEQELEAFVEEHMRRTDLLFTRRRAAWLLVAPCSPGGPQQWIQRLRKAHEQACDTLPAIELQVKGTWRIADEASALIRAFKREMARPGKDRDAGTGAMAR